jgi:Predicted nucleotide-binding protein containing TIR-like domain
MIKPSVFVGSSSEALPIAQAIQEELSHDAKVTIWSQDVFQLSRSAIENLSRAVHKFDFAIFVFAPDDQIILRGSRLNAVRDNVIYELGLFAGWLGYERTFIIQPRGASKFRIPTDLLGLTIADYDPTREDNLIASVGPACNKIRRSMKSLGYFSVEDRAMSHDSIPHGMNLSISNIEVAGYWLSRFTFNAHRNGGFVEGVQYNIEYLVPHGKSALSGKNIICSMVDNHKYLHETKSIIVKDHILGRWFNTNSQNFGIFQLQIYNNNRVMKGSHSGNANDNSVQSGEWLWVSINTESKDTKLIDKFRKSKLKKTEDMDKIFYTSMETYKSINLSDIIA